MTLIGDNGLIHLPSSRPVPDTMDLLKSIVQRRGLHIAARVDHGREAASVSLVMPPCELLIFGNPVAGTPLMLSSPTLAIDLPLKVLVWEDTEQRVWITYNTPVYLQERHQFSEALLGNLDGLRSICEEAAEWSSS